MPRCAPWLFAVAGVAVLGCGRVGFGSRGLGARDGAAPGEPDAGRGTTCGDGEVSGSEICDDGNIVSGDGCSADCSARELCGDGIATAGEACDDGNGIDDDGCRSDCTFTCTASTECDDGLLCNGVESCNDALHRCALGPPATDGTSCGGSQVCRGGSCAPAGCGDGSVDADEECDDENLVDGDGCDNDCTLSCETVAECDDAAVCNGAETCEANVCVEPDLLPADGFACDRDGDSGTRDICLGGDCRRSSCGDHFVDAMASPPEDCDDDNLVNGDGCDNDCTFSCTTDAECSDGAVCNGVERCIGHQCGAALTTPADGSPCPGGRCFAGSCVPFFPMDGGFPRIDGGGPLPPLPDSGGVCPDPPTSGMPLECFRRCVIEEECVLAQTSCCCSCAQGGGWEAISSRFTSHWTAGMSCGPCGDVMCLDIYACPSPPSCVGGVCMASGGSSI